MSVPLVAVVAFNHFNPFHLSVPCIFFGDLLHDRKLFDIGIYTYESGKLRSSEELTVESTLDAMQIKNWLQVQLQFFS